MADTRYLKRVKNILSRYSRGAYHTLDEIDTDINELGNFSNYLEGIVLNLGKQRERLVDEARLNWMNLREISEKYNLSLLAVYQKLRKLSAEKRRVGKKIEYVITDDLVEKLKTDGRSLRYAGGIEEKARKQAEIEDKVREKRGYIPTQKLLKRCNLTAIASLYHRLKQYKIPYGTRKIGKRLYFKRPSTDEIRLLRHRKRKYESIEGIKNSILHKAKKPRTLPGHVRLEDINRYLGTTDGQILDFMTELGITPHFVRAYGHKDPQFPRKYYRIFKKMLKEKEK